MGCATSQKDGGAVRVPDGLLDALGRTVEWKEAPVLRYVDVRYTPWIGIGDVRAETRYMVEVDG